jgi:hypothetical protein
MTEFLSLFLYKKKTSPYARNAPTSQNITLSEKRSNTYAICLHVDAAGSPRLAQARSHQQSSTEQEAMAQDGRARESSSKAASAGSGGCSMPFRLNVHAREFVPVASPLAAAAAGGGYYSPFVQLSGDGGLGTDWMNFFAEPDPTSPSSFLPDFGHCDILRATGGINGYPNPKGGASVADIADKIVKQVRNLLA